MTTVQTRVRSISDLEGFDLTVKKDGEEVDVRENGVLSKYPFDKALKGTKTVADWKNVTGGVKTSRFWRFENRVVQTG